MNRRQKIIVSVTGIFLVLLILVGLTYAYFLTQIQGNENTKSITVTTANLVLEYGDGNGILETDKLEPSNDFIQFKDSEGNPVPSKIFTVTNRGNATVEGYKVYLEKVQNQLVRKDDLVYTLSCKAYTNYGENNQAEVESGCNGVSETTFPSVVTSIVSNVINVGETHVYELKAKYKEMGVDQSIDMNKLITAKINIYDASTKFLASEIISSAVSNTNGTNYVEPNMLGVTENTTIPAEQLSTIDEKVLSYTFDDYGTSYYFRGSVTNNYVNFHGMCWRIVRIEGDGSIKMIIETEVNECDVENYQVDWEKSSNILKLGNFGYDNVTYEGKTVINYLNPSTDSVNTALSTQFKNFQETLTSDEISKLKSGDWCLSDTAYATKKVDFNTDKPIDKLTYYNAQNQVDGSPYYNFYYDGVARLAIDGNDVKSPTLKCTGTMMNKFGDDTDMYVATLTADEAAYAGYQYLASSELGADNDNYLSIARNFWTLTPRRYEADGATNVMIGWYTPQLHAFHVNDERAVARAAISLLNGTEIISGDGTQSNPYIIK